MKEVKPIYEGSRPPPLCGADEEERGFGQAASTETEKR